MEMDSTYTRLPSVRLSFDHCKPVIFGENPQNPHRPQIQMNFLPKQSSCEHKSRIQKSHPLKKVCKCMRAKGGKRK